MKLTKFQIELVEAAFEAGFESAQVLIAEKLYLNDETKEIAVVNFLNNLLKSIPTEANNE